MQQSTADIVAVIIASGILALISAVFWVIALVDVLRRPEWDFPSSQFGSNTRIVWVFVVLVLNIFGSLMYYFLVMRQHPRQRR